MNSSVKNRRVDRISILLQEYNIEKIIHIKGQHNCLADYLSRYPNSMSRRNIRGRLWYKYVVSRGITIDSGRS